MIRRRKEKNGIRFALNTLSAVLIALSAARAEDPGGDLAKLQGTWRQFKGYTIEGKEVDKSRYEKLDTTTKFVGASMTNHFKLNGKYQELTWPIILDPNKRPKTIDWIRGEDRVVLGLYEVEGDLLKIAWASGTSRRQPRPETLGPCPEGNKNTWTYAIYKRID